MRYLSRVAVLVSGFALAVWAQPGHTQLTPDGTLGSDSSVVMPGEQIRGDVADLIEGGAIRGGNLFHERSIALKLGEVSILA